MRVRHKPWARDYLDTLAFHKIVDMFSFSALPLGDFSEVAVEIGVGKGDFLLLMAEKYRDVFFIGVELNASVLSIAAQKLSDAKLNNVMIINGDALLLLPKIPQGTVDYVILNHSDPWPKKRHEKRRLTFPQFVDEYFRILKDGGALRFKSDNDEFSQYSADIINMYPFKSINFDINYDGSDNFDAQTEYEKKFRAKGVKIKRIIAKK